MQFGSYTIPAVCCRCVTHSAALAPACLSLKYSASLGQQNRESAFAVVGKEPAQFVLSPKEQGKLEGKNPCWLLREQRNYMLSFIILALRQSHN